MGGFVNGVERRQFGRRRTCLHGWIKLPGRAPVGCIVRDISQGGALIEVPADMWLPFTFRISIESEGIERDCEIRHQRDALVGVCFAESARAGSQKHDVTLEEVGSWHGARSARLGR